MKRVLTFAVVVAVALAVASVPSFAQLNFKEFTPGGFSIVVRDVEKSAAAWADLLGVPLTKPFVPENVVYPPKFDGTRTGLGPKIISLRGVTLHQPPEGKNYWRELLDAHGEILYRVGWRVRDLKAMVAHFEGHGGKLVWGDPSQPREAFGTFGPYTNVSLWPKLGVAMEINEMPATAPAAPANPPVPLPATSFGSNRQDRMAFVVTNLEQAIKDYSGAFGIPPESAAHVTRPSGFPAKTATLVFPNGFIFELNEPLPGQNIFRTQLQKRGQSMFSPGYKVMSVRDQVAYLKGKGGTLVLGGGENDKYAYVDFSSRLGAIIEVHE